MVRLGQGLLTMLAVLLSLCGGASLLQAAPERPVVAVIIDDLGDRPEAGRRAVQLPGPVAAAFLPHAPHTRRLAALARGEGKEVLVHMPMQPVNGMDPGPGALTLDMDETRFRETVGRALQAVPGAVGMNNHMGSLITQHPGHMTWLMALLREHRRDMLYVDSRTTSRTVAIAMARESRVAHLQRDVFLDHHRNPERILQQFHRLVAHARRHGTAVGIGHPYPQTLVLLERELPRLETWYGVELVSLRELRRRRSGIPGGGIPSDR